jgi:peptide/nickel transport system permease protein
MIELAPVLVIISIIVFVLIRLLPGDPIEAVLGPEAGTLDPEQRQVLERQLGLDQPIPVQYVQWLKRMVQGDWGRSLVSRRPVADEIRQRLTRTLQVALCAWLVGLMVAVPIGVISALRRNTWLDVGITAGALAGAATPSFLLALLLVYVFAVRFHILPTRGFVSLTEDPVQALRHLALPTIALATGLMASLIRQTRSGVLEVMNEDYVRTANAKGVANRVVLTRHVLKNALMPVVTVAGLQIGNLAAGTIIIETMFSIPGMGSLTVNAVLQHDYLTIQIVVLILAVSTVLANLLADLTYVVLDPRIRLK